MSDELSDSLLINAAFRGGDSMESAVNIADMLLDVPRHHQVSHPNVLSQLAVDDAPVYAGQLETCDGGVLPITIGHTDIGNGKPVPYLHISDDPSVLSRHITITAVQTNDGKFRAMLRVNHPHGRVLLGGSVVRSETLYPIMDDDEIILGDGVKFRLRLNNVTAHPYKRHSLGGPTQQYVPAPDSDEMHEMEEREKEEKRRQFQERLTPPTDDSLLMQLAAAADPDNQSQRHISLVHQVGDTFPYSSSRASSATSSQMAADTAMVSPQRAEHNEVLTQQIGSDGPATPAQEIIPEDASEGTLPPPDELDDEDFVVIDQVPDGNEDSYVDDVQADEVLAEEVDVVESPKDVEVEDLVPVESPEEAEAASPVESPEGAQAASPVESPGEANIDENAAGESPEGMDEGSTDPANRPSISAPQLSQVISEPAASPLTSLLDRLEQKRPLRDATNDVPEPKKMKTRSVKSSPQHSDSDSAPVVRTSRRSSQRELAAAPSRKSNDSDTPTSSGFANGPKKLVLLKTAIELDKQTESAVASVGAKIESKWTDRVDALVTGSIVRTTKFLCAINKGLAIFPKSVLSDIKTFKALPPTDLPDLWLQDSDGEAKYEFSLQQSILKARHAPLLAGFEVYFFKNSIGEFSADELKDLVTTAGGKLLARLPKEVGDKVIVIGAEANRASAKAAGAKALNKIEFLVDACIKQKLDFTFAKIPTR